MLEINEKDKRLDFERKIIGTVSNCKECKPSENWLGNFSPIDKIKKNGLWLVQELYKSELIKQDLIEIENYLIK